MSPTGPRLAPVAFLDVRLLIPVGWTAHRTVTGRAAGTVQYVAPGRRGTVYVEQNDCAACVDEGLVTHGHRSGVPDPDAAAASYFPVTKHRIDAYRLAFSAAAPAEYVASGRLVVTRVHGALTGYVVVVVTVPKAESVTATRILASLRVSSARSG